MIDLETLLAQLSAGPSDADKQAARAQAAMAMGLGLLGTPGGRRNPWAGLAQGAAMGMGAYNDSLAQARQQPMDRLKAAGAVMDYQAKGMDVKTKQAALDEMERQRQEAAMARDVLRGFQMPAPLPSMAPTNENAARLAATPKAGLFEKLNAQADALEAKGLVQQAQQYRTLAEKYAPQYEGMETVMRDGKPVVLQRFKNRAPEETGYMPKPDYKQVDTGGQVGFYDPLTGQAGGQFAKTATPDANLQATVAREGHGVTMRGQNMTDARARDANMNAAGAKVSDAVKDIRKEYSSLDQVKAYRAAAPIVESARNAPDTPAGDLDLIYAVGKALDPNSVVREGEMHLVIKSGSPLQKFQGYVNYIANGRGRLPQAQREELLTMLDGRVAQLKASHDAAAAPYMQQAQSMGLPMDQIFQPIGGGGKLTPAEQTEFERLKRRFGIK